MRIQACPNCGSTNLEWVGGGANAVFDFSGASSLSGLSHCGNCGGNVLPIEFSSQKGYTEFAGSLKRKGTKCGAPATERMAGQPAEAGINLSRGYSGLLAVVFAIVSIGLLASYLLSGGMFGLLSAVIFALLAAYLYTRRRK